MGLQSQGLNPSLRNLSTGVGAIPDSALLHFPFKQRSGSTLVEELQGADGAAHGLTNISGTYRDGYAESGDGTDDYGDLGDWSGVNFGTRLTSNWGLAFTVETTDNGVILAGLLDPATWGFAFHLGRLGTSGKIQFRIEDKYGNGNKQKLECSTTVNNGSKYRILVGGDGPAASDKVFYVNGSDETSVTNNEGDHAPNPVNFGNIVSTHARSDGGGTFLDHADAVIDNIIPLDTKPTSTVAQKDYNNQPWS